MNNRSATPSAFGWNFQVNAAIVIMLDNLKAMTSMRLEGNEDIEINLEDGTSILAQAKSVVRSSEDFDNVLKNLKKSLCSLSEAYHSTSSVKQLIYITNSPNPLNISAEMHIFAGAPAYRTYHDLPKKSRNKIDKILSNITSPLDKSKLIIQTLPFETNNDKERYKHVWLKINEFLSNIGEDRLSIIELHNIWQGDIFKSGTKNDYSIKLTKKDLIWPVIVILTEKETFTSEFNEELDDAEIEEISRAYKDIINTCTERFEFFTKVLYEFNTFRQDNKGKEGYNNFINSESQNFAYIFDDNEINIDESIQSTLLKIIVKKIIDKRFRINTIKQAVNL